MTTYISFRWYDYPGEDEEIKPTLERVRQYVRWIETNTDYREYHRFFDVNIPHAFKGVFLEDEDALIFKLKFGL